MKVYTTIDPLRLLHLHGIAEDFSPQYTTSEDRVQYWSRYVHHKKPINTILQHPWTMFLALVE